MPSKKVVTKSAPKPVKRVAASKRPVAKKVQPVVKPMATMTTPVVVPKMDTRRLIKPLLVLLVLGVLYLIKDEIIVASVNGKPVTRIALLRSLEQQAAATTLENLTLQMLVEQELRKAGVEVDEAELDAELAKIEEQLASQGQNLDDLLKAQGLTRAQVKEQLALTKGLEKLLGDKVSVSEEEITAYFAENKEMLGDVTLEDVRADIEAQLRQEKMSTEQQNWFSEVRKNADIKYYKFAPSKNL